MDDNDSRVVHALCEIIGLAISVWALDHMTDGALREQARPAGRWFLKRWNGFRAWMSMLTDALNSGQETIAIAEKLVRKDAL